MRITDNLQENFPFISVLKHAEKEYVGIIINQDNNVTSFYDYEHLKSKKDQEKFIELGEAWWWESNRMIPINLFLKTDFAIFTSTLLTFNIKDTEILKGGSVSIADLAKKRSKRRNIQLVRKVK